MALTRETILDHLGSRMGVDTAGLDDETPLFSGGILDSFSMVDLILFIESATGQRMSPTEVNLDNLDSVARILRYADRAGAA